MKGLADLGNVSEMRVLNYFTALKAGQELIEKFGDDYRRYMQKVPRMNFFAGVIRLLRRKAYGRMARAIAVFRRHHIILISFYIVIFPILVVSCATLTPEVTEAVTTVVIALTPTEETIVPEPTPEMTHTPVPRATPTPGATSFIPPTTPTATLESPVLPVTPSPDLASLELAMVNAINEERQKWRLPPYRVDQQLTIVAREHALDMVARGRGELAARRSAGGRGGPICHRVVYGRSSPS
jgi:hypothetical protein